jgi:hypothetical protein
MKLEGVVREKLGVLFRRFVLFAQNSGDELGEYVRENLVVLFRRFLLFAWDVRCNRESHYNCEPRHGKNCIFLQSTLPVRLNMSDPNNGQALSPTQQDTRTRRRAFVA